MAAPCPQAALASPAPSTRPSPNALGIPARPLPVSPPAPPGKPGERSTAMFAPAPQPCLHFSLTSRGKAVQPVPEGASAGPKRRLSGQTGDGGAANSLLSLARPRQVICANPGQRPGTGGD